MGKPQRAHDEVVKTCTVLSWLYCGLREAISSADHNSPLYGLEVSHDGDHKGSEIIITDRNGDDWIVREDDIRKLKSDE